MSCELETEAEIEIEIEIKPTSNLILTLALVYLCYLCFLKFFLETPERHIHYCRNYFGGSGHEDLDQNPLSHR